MAAGSQSTSNTAGTSSYRYTVSSRTIYFCTLKSLERIGSARILRFWPFPILSGSSCQSGSIRTGIYTFAYPRLSAHMFCRITERKGQLLMKNLHHLAVLTTY